MNWLKKTENVKVPPTMLKHVAMLLIGCSAAGYPITALTIARSEPPIVLFLSWAALLLTGFSFYTSAQDGEDIDAIRENQEKIMKKMGVK